MKRFLGILIGVLSFSCCFAQVGVTFNLLLPAGARLTDSLYLAGSFNNWNPADTNWRFKKTGGSFVLFKTLNKGLYEYKATRGNWDRAESDSTGAGIENRQLTLANDTSIAITVANWQDNFKKIAPQHTALANVHIINEDFYMPQLGRKRRIWIYLPDNYTFSAARFPVIYMHDGQNLFDAFTSGFGEWGIDEFMHTLPARQQCIVVGIDHGGDNRITEYDPYDSKYGNGRGDDYVGFVVNTLKPYIDKHYLTLPDAKHTSIAGSSMGGLISYYAATKYPQVFGTAGVFSPACWIAPPVYALKTPAGKHIAKYYFACGDAESETMVADMKKMAAKQGSNATVIVLPGQSHNEKQWRQSFPQYYQWLQAQW